jgi:nucleoside-diphosphate-sugar epimerase
MNESGGYKSVISAFKTLRKNNKPLTINNTGNQRRDFIHVKDVVEANIIVVKNIDKCTGESYNVGRGENYTVNQIATMFNCPTIKGKDVKEPFNSLADISKLKKIGWKPMGSLKTFISTIEK